MYKAASSQPGSQSPPSDGGQTGGDQGKKDGKDNVVDAEFVDVDDKK